MPGFKEADLYSLKGPNYVKAKALAAGNTRAGKAVMYTFNTAQGPPIAQSVQFNLKQIGIAIAMPDDHAIHPDTVGFPFPGTELRIADEDGRALPRGDYRVRITVGRGAGRVVSTLVSRRTGSSMIRSQVSMGGAGVAADRESRMQRSTDMLSTLAPSG